MNKVRLHRSDLEKILNYIDTLDPDKSRGVDVGLITITETSNSGIGPSISAVIEYTVLDCTAQVAIDLTDVTTW